MTHRDQLEAALLAALHASPAGLQGLTARARTLAQAPGLTHEVSIRAALQKFERDGWISVQPGRHPRYALTPLGRDRHAWHLMRGTLDGQAPT